MKTLEKLGVVFLAAWMVVGVAQASSSVNGSPGRSDFNKRKSLQSSKSTKPIEAVPTPKPAVVSVENSDAVDEAKTHPQEQRVEALPLAAARSVSLVSPAVESSVLTEGPSAPAPLAESSDKKTVPAPQVAPSPLIVTAIKETAPVVVPVIRPDPPPASASPEVVAVPESALKISYANVLTDRQKALLKARAEDLKLKEDDYDNLLSPDERERLDELVRERRRAMASGE